MNSHDRPPNGHTQGPDPDPDPGRTQDLTLVPAADAPPRACDDAPDDPYASFAVWKDIDERFDWKGRQFRIREATEDTLVKHQNAQMRAARLGKDGRPVGVDGLADAEPILVAGCLWEYRAVRVRGAETQSWVKFTVDQIRLDFPGRFISTVHDRCMELHGLKSRPTVESLNKQIAALTKQRDELLAKGQAGRGDGSRSGQSDPEEGAQDQAKNWPGATTGISG